MYMLLLLTMLTGQLATVLSPIVIQWYGNKRGMDGSVSTITPPNNCIYN